MMQFSLNKSTINPKTEQCLLKDGWLNYSNVKMKMPLENGYFGHGVWFFWPKKKIGLELSSFKGIYIMNNSMKRTILWVK